MKSYNPSFQDRVASAKQAKQKALEQLRAKPPVDEAVVAERQAAREAREAREAEKRIAREAARKEEAEKKAAERLANAKPELTDAERKAIRDARYAARKSRK